MKIPNNGSISGWKPEKNNQIKFYIKAPPNWVQKIHRQK